MVQNYEYFCNHCHYFIETGGPWPYAKEGRGRRQYKNLHEACSGPIHGLIANVYCPACDRGKTYPIVEYGKPLFSLSEIWLSDIPRKTKRVCHKCKNPVFLTLAPGAVRCPRCKKGTFEVWEPLEEDSRQYPVSPPKSPLKVRQKGKSVPVPKPTVVIDSQEHMGYRFERFSNWFAGTIRKRLPIGDYTLLGMENEVIVERKTVPDLVKSIIQERGDFIRKCERLSAFKKKCMVIEGSMACLKTPYEDSMAHPNAVFGSLMAAQERWDIPVYFLDNFLLAEEFVASMLSKYHAYQWLEINGFQRCLIEGDI
ncbi:MAG: hypothetical protein A2169_02405 [Deltaproteobacteria bacterium RBG_13_47_9]|nr:MAG: hypothetical protein A2169_02405 [Deltaproteobacteria bacterium RBG_13_47_9]